MTVGADAHPPVIHVDGHFAQPTTIDATAKFWRKTEPAGTGIPTVANPDVASGATAPHAAPDLFFSHTPTRIAWCHFNPDSYFPYVITQEHLESILGKIPHPLLHRCFGAALFGQAFTASLVVAQVPNVTALIQCDFTDTK